VPDPKGTALNLDVSSGLRIDPKFSKHNLALNRANSAEWDNVSVADEMLPVVSSREAARIAILRSIFRLPARSISGWIRLDQGSAALLDAYTRAGSEIAEFVFRLRDGSMTCRFRRYLGVFEIRARTLWQMRSAIRSASGYGVAGQLLLPVIAPLVLGLRQTAYAIGKRLTRRFPTRNITKRTLLRRGAIVALIGPDGVDKSTQARRLRKFFGRKFLCDTVYPGSNDGARMAWRGRLRRKIFMLLGKRMKPAQAGKDRAYRPLSYRLAIGKGIW